MADHEIAEKGLGRSAQGGSGSATRSLTAVLLGVVAVALVLILATVFVVSYVQTDSSLPGFVDAGGERIYPGLERRAGDIASIEIEKGDSRLTLRRSGSQWGLAERDGYPLVEGKVGTLLDEVAALRAVYVSEDTEPAYSELGVEDPFGPDGAAVRVTFRDGDGGAVAQAQVSDTFSVPGGVEITKVMVRRNEDRRVWIADGEFEVNVNQLDWVNRDIMDVPSSRVAEIAVTPPEGSGQRLVIGQTSQGEFEIREGRPSDGSSQIVEAMQLMAGSFEVLQFEDVRRRDALAADTGDPWLATARMRDGVTYRVRLLPDRGTAWAEFSADVSEGVPREDEGAVPAAGTAGGENGEEKAEFAGAKERVREFNARHGEWAYLLPAYVAERLMVRPSDVVE